jgi:Domain of unknown function (DUF3859)
MRRGCYLPLLLIAACFVQPGVAGVRGTVINYGITVMSGKQIKVPSPLSPTGVRTIGDNIVIHKTDRIPARIGLSFGITYHIDDLPFRDGEVIKVVRTITFPSMTKPNGSKLNRVDATFELLVNNGRAFGKTGYTFEYQYELVPGMWKFAVSFEDKTICEKSFVVSAE